MSEDKKNLNHEKSNSVLDELPINDLSIDPMDSKVKELLAIEHILEKYVLSVNTKYHSHVFPSSQLTKVVMKKLNIKNKNMFRIYHGKVKKILKKWEGKNYCEHVDTTHYSHCKKTKKIYQFKDDTFYRFNLYKMIPIR
ncbi:MAG: hypothetical protein EU551_00025 [Promethearchaeota archaeon]|nr:MAG: hypothetical protein EU551_00025 [Candidatus Lokiarchaeota archaeon]